MSGAKYAPAWFVYTDIRVCGYRKPVEKPASGIFGFGSSKSVAAALPAQEKKDVEK